MPHGAVHRPAEGENTPTDAFIIPYRLRLVALNLHEFLARRGKERPGELAAVNQPFHNRHRASDPFSMQNQTARHQKRMRDGSATASAHIDLSRAALGV